MPPDPLKLKQWGGIIIYEYQEHLSSDHLKEKLGFRTPRLNFERP